MGSDKQGTETHLSQLLFGRPIRDQLPVKPSLFSPSEVWVTNREQRELALRHRVSRGGERWSEHTRTLPRLDPGSQVFVQNQRGVGKAVKRWDRSGTVIEDEGNDKYMIKIDGSGRIEHRTQDCSPGMARPSMDTRYSVIGGGENGDGENKLDLSLDLSHDPGSFVTPPTTPMKSPAAEPTPDSLARSEVSPPAVTPTKPALAPTRRSDRAQKPNNKYSAKEYDLSAVWYWGGGDSE